MNLEMGLKIHKKEETEKADAGKRRKSESIREKHGELGKVG